MNDQPDFDDIPESLLDKTRTFQMEPANDKYWCFFTGHRSAGDIQAVPLNETIKWILEQISFGHFTGMKDESGDIVSVRIGKESAAAAESKEALAKNVFRELLGFQVAGALAQCREAGSHESTSDFEKQIWAASDQNAQRRMEFHYAIQLAQMLGHISKKLPRLEHLPILDNAPAKTKQYIAEATRCYLFKLDNACISLCRACLEDTLNGLVTGQIQDEIDDEIFARRKRGEPYGRLFITIEVLASHGLLGDYHSDAHAVRLAGNATVHPNSPQSANSKQAEDVLTKTRRILSFVHRK